MEATNTAPVVTITSPADNSTVTVGDPVSFSGTATDEDGDLSANLVWASDVEGGPIGTGASFATSALSEGIHTITASVSDSGSPSLTGQAQITLTVSAANTAPVVTITSPADNSTVTVGDPVSFSGTAMDEDGDLSANLVWTSDLEGGPIGSGASFATSALSEGIHTITASVSDSGTPSLTGQAQITLTVADETLRIPWTEQPPPGTPLDEEHPLYQHLIFFADFKDGAPFEHVSQEYGVYNINAIGQAIEDIGIVGQFDDGQNNGGADFVKHDELHGGLAQVTVMSYAKRNNDLINSTESTMAYAGSGSDPWDISIAPDGDLRFRIEILDTKSIDELTQSAGGYDLSEWNIMGGTWDGTTIVARANKVWGSGTASDTGTLTAGSASTNNPRLGQRQNGATDSWYGWVAFGAVWSVDIGDDWWSSLSDNPWQLYKPMEIPNFNADSSGVTGSLPEISEDATSATSGELEATVETSNNAPVVNGDDYATDEGATPTVSAPDELANDNDADGILILRLEIPISIDIKPGVDPNGIDPSGKQEIPVAVLTTEDFDATQIDWETVSFGWDGANEVHGLAHIEDVDLDGDVDMVLHFDTQETGIMCGDKEATLTGKIFSGETVKGTDTIVTVNCD